MKPSNKTSTAAAATVVAVIFALLSGGVVAGCSPKTEAVQSDADPQQAQARPADTATSATASTLATGDPDVPYVPTNQNTVERMLELMDLDAEDVVYDLGSGDGRIVITAAQQYEARGVGIEIDPARVAEARENAEEAGVADLVEFRQGDLFEADLSEATAVTLYLLPSVNMELRPKLFEELAPGTPVVSHAFDMDDWEPERTVQVGGDMVYLWRIPEDSTSISPGE